MDFEYILLVQLPKGEEVKTKIHDPIPERAEQRAESIVRNYQEDWGKKDRLVVVTGQLYRMHTEFDGPGLLAQESERKTA